MRFRGRCGGHGGHQGSGGLVVSGVAAIVTCLSAVFGAFLWLVLQQKLSLAISEIDHCCIIFNCCIFSRADLRRGERNRERLREAREPVCTLRLGGAPPSNLDFAVVAELRRRSRRAPEEEDRGKTVELTEH